MRRWSFAWLCIAAANRYDIRFEEVGSLTGTAPATRDKALHEWMRNYARRLEVHIRSAPFNWFNFYDYWGDSCGG